MPKKTPPKEESDLFRQLVGKIKPVKSDRVILMAGNKPKPYPKAKANDFEAVFTANTVDDIESLQPQDIVSYSSPGVQKKIIIRLRKGLYGVDAKIDLHGLVSAEAKHQLSKFLVTCIENGVRCAHIIHGKGYGSADNKPVLKNKVNLWLRQHQDVLAFCSSLPRQGGAGAVYVLLRSSGKYREQDDA